LRYCRSKLRHINTDRDDAIGSGLCGTLHAAEVTTKKGALKLALTSLPLEVEEIKAFARCEDGIDCERT